jgi:hypothetical protein
MCGQRREAGPRPGGGDVTAGGPRVPFGRGEARVERVNMWGVALTVPGRNAPPPAAAFTRGGCERGHRPGLPRLGCAGRGVARAGSARGLRRVGLVLGRAVRQRGGEHGLHRAYRRLDGGVRPWGAGRIRVTYATRRRRGPPPARFGRAVAARGRHVACTSRAIATRRRRLTKRPSARPSASAAGEGDCSARTAAACSSSAIATRRRQHTVWPLGALLRQRG